jgi:hypothetical protein
VRGQGYRIGGAEAGKQPQSISMVPPVLTLHQAAL